VAIVQTVYELACIYSDNRPGYKSVSAHSLATLMSFTAQPAADLRLVRPEVQSTEAPGNNERPVSVLNMHSYTASRHPSNNVVGSARFAEVVLGSPGGAAAPFAPYWLRHCLHCVLRKFRYLQK